MKKFVIAFLLLFVVTGCNAIKGTKLPDNFADKLPSEYMIKVPHIMQYDGYSCASTSLAMVMSYYDEVRYDKREVWDSSESSVHMVTEVCGNDMNGLKKAAENYGFSNFEFAVGLSLDELKYLVSQDIPVIVNIRNFYSKSYHAVVIAGYDDMGVIIVDPASGVSWYRKDYKTFMSHWYARLCSPRKAEFRKSAFILYPKEQ